MKKFILFLSVVALLSTTITSRAQNYGLLGTIWSATSLTNIPATITNVAATVNVSAYTEILLSAKIYNTNNTGGWIDLHYCTSADGTNFCDSPLTTITHAAAGVISIPLTNTGTFTVWTTNVTVGSFGYWQVDAITNNSTCHLTNVLIEVLAKPTLYR